MTEIKASNAKYKDGPIFAWKREHQGAEFYCGLVAGFRNIPCGVNLVPKSQHESHGGGGFSRLSWVRGSHALVQLSSFIYDGVPILRIE